MKPAYSGKSSQSRGSRARNVMKSTPNDHKMSDAETERKNKVFTENILRVSTQFCPVIQFQQDHALPLCTLYQKTTQLGQKNAVDSVWKEHCRSAGVMNRSVNVTVYYRSRKHLFTDRELDTTVQ
jgi:hypothetical protein